MRWTMGSAGTAPTPTWWWTRHAGEAPKTWRVLPWRCTNAGPVGSAVWKSALPVPCCSNGSRLQRGLGGVGGACLQRGWGPARAGSSYSFFSCIHMYTVYKYIYISINTVENNEKELQSKGSDAILTFDDYFVSRESLARFLYSSTFM